LKYLVISTKVYETVLYGLKGAYKKAGDRHLQGPVVTGQGLIALNWKRGDLD